jgi:hypothetical protein
MGMVCYKDMGMDTAFCGRRDSISHSVGKAGLAARTGHGVSAGVC